MQSLSTETSLIATSTHVEEVIDAPMMDIPQDLDIEVVYYKVFLFLYQIFGEFSYTRLILDHMQLSSVRP